MSIYLIVIIVLAVIALILAALLWKYQRQMKQICRQLSFLEEHDSNMRIRADIEFGGFRELLEKINSFIDRQKEEHKNYVNKEKLISDIYTNLSHDIRTPLTSLDGYFQLLEQGANEEEQERYLAVIRERIYCLKEMLEELFTFSKLENGEYELPLSKCCINRILKDTIFSYYEDWREKGIEPHIEITDEQLFLLGNEQALRRTIQNVIKNGLDHGERMFKITLCRENQDIHLKIGNSVSDTDAKEIDTTKIFERFYKTDLSRNKTSSGLGLSIAKEFVERMDGTMNATLTGNEFWIEMAFPIYLS